MLLRRWTQQKQRCPSMRYRFGPYELDTARNELSKYGLHLKLERKPLQVLAALVERAGDLVTRGDLKRKLWGEDLFGDFDKRLNVAVAKLRATLNDSPEKPAYIETVTSEGYRFIGKLEPDIVSPVRPDIVSPVPPAQPKPGLERSTLLLGITALALLIAVGTTYRLPQVRAFKAATPANSPSLPAGKKATAALLYVLNQGAHSVSALDTTSRAVA